jgi:large subunit ribosomal protein L6e
MGKNPATYVAQGVTALGRAKTYKRRGLFAIKKKNGGTFPTTPKQAKTAVAATKKPRFYPADDVAKPQHTNIVRKPTKLRASITPGTVLILLAGRFKGKRVICLGQLPSGLLLVSGPFKINGVPVKRVNQAYVIATSTKVTLPALDLSKFTDSFFKAVEAKGDKKGEKEFFDGEAKKKELAAEYIQAQKAMDVALLPALTAELKGYLAARFSLKQNDRPHLMKF